jgi:ABC-type phosphate/phosphonate transport system substrate-binding protein
MARGSEVEGARRSTPPFYRTGRDDACRLDAMPSITLAVVPSATPGDSRTALGELCKALGKLLDATVTCIHPETYSDLTSELEKDRVQYAWMSPALLVMAGEHIQLRPLLSAERHGSTEYCGALFVDGERSIKTIPELRGKTIAWVDRTSAAGYLYPRLAIAAQQLDPDNFFCSCGRMPRSCARCSTAAPTRARPTRSGPPRGSASVARVSPTSPLTARRASSG